MSSAATWQYTYATATHLDDMGVAYANSDIMSGMNANTMFAVALQPISGCASVQI